MSTSGKESETVVIRDSMNGNKLYEIVKLNGEALIFDYVASSKRKVEASKVYEWLRPGSLGVVIPQSYQEILDESYHGHWEPR
jgi:hypothetical protein